MKNHSRRSSKASFMPLANLWSHSEYFRRIEKDDCENYFANNTMFKKRKDQDSKILDKSITETNNKIMQEELSKSILPSLFQNSHEKPEVVINSETFGNLTEKLTQQTKKQNNNQTNILQLTNELEKQGEKKLVRIRWEIDNLRKLNNSSIKNDEKAGYAENYHGIKRKIRNKILSDEDILNRAKDLNSDENYFYYDLNQIKLLNKKNDLKLPVIYEEDDNLRNFDLSRNKKIFSDHINEILNRRKNFYLEKLLSLNGEPKNNMLKLKYTFLKKNK